MHQFGTPSNVQHVAAGRDDATMRDVTPRGVLARKIDDGDMQGICNFP